MMRRATFLAISLGLLLPSLGQAQNDGRSTRNVFPQIADGYFSDGSYYTSTLIFSNPSGTASGTCALTLWMSGQAFSGNYTIGASQWIIDPTTEPGVIPSHPFLGGYAILDCGTLPVNASLLYSFYDRSGYKQGEATVFQSVIGHRVQIIGDQTENARVGIAIVNDTAASQTSTIRVGDDQGQMAATRNVTIPAHSNKVGFLSELVGWTGTKGQVLIDCPSGCAAIALRYTGAVFTTIPSSIRLQ